MITYVFLQIFVNMTTKPQNIEYGQNITTAHLSEQDLLPDYSVYEQIPANSPCD